MTTMSKGMSNNYGTAPWPAAPSANDAAAQLLAENHNRAGGSWDKAIAMYSGGNHPGPSAYRYQARVGNFDNSGASAMPQSLYPVANGVDPLAAVVPPKAPAPIPGSLGPSVNVPVTSPVANQKRGGILGALESVFMPDPSSRWAGALRDGIFNAKESQQNYAENEAKKMLDLQTANQKLKAVQQHGEYQVVGNNVFHAKPDGTTEMISGTSATDDKTKLADVWAARRVANPNDPTLPLLEGIIFGNNYGNTPEGAAATNATRRATATERANATIKAAGIRGAFTGNQLPPLPLGAKVIH